MCPRRWSGSLPSSLTRFWVPLYSFGFRKLFFKVSLVYYVVQTWPCVLQAVPCSFYIYWLWTRWSGIMYSTTSMGAQPHMLRAYLSSGGLVLLSVFGGAFRPENHCLSTTTTTMRCIPRGIQSHLPSLFLRKSLQIILKINPKKNEGLAKLNSYISSPPRLCCRKSRDFWELQRTNGLRALLEHVSHLAEDGSVFLS